MVPPVTPAAPDSRPAADLALVLETMVLQNRCCLSCGGSRMSSLPEIVWYDPPRPASVDGMPPIAGTVHGIDFEANYSPAVGWQINIHAC